MVAARFTELLHYFAYNFCDINNIYIYVYLTWILLSLTILESRQKKVGSKIMQENVKVHCFVVGIFAEVFSSFSKLQCGAIKKLFIFA